MSNEADFFTGQGNPDVPFFGCWQCPKCGSYDVSLTDELAKMGCNKCGNTETFSSTEIAKVGWCEAV